MKKYIKKMNIKRLGKNYEQLDQQNALQKQSSVFVFSFTS